MLAVHNIPTSTRQLHQPLTMVASTSSFPHHSRSAGIPSSQLLTSTSAVHTSSSSSVASTSSASPLRPTQPPLTPSRPLSAARLIAFTSGLTLVVRLRPLRLMSRWSGTHSCWCVEFELKLVIDGFVNASSHTEPVCIRQGRRKYSGFD